LRPRVGKQIVREFLDAFVTVSPFDGAMCSLVCRGHDDEVMNAHLAQVAAQFSADFCIIFLDGAGWHVAHDLRVPHHLRLIQLPPRSPELNPAEPIWDHLAENYLANRVFPSLQAVERVVCRGLRALHEAPNQVRSITLFNWIAKVKPYL
jgi:transposase